MIPTFKGISKNLILISLTSLLLALSFPPYDISWLAWVSLVPLILALKEKPPLQCFFLALVCGLLYYPAITRWIFAVQGYTLVHHVLLDLYLSSFFGIFGLTFAIIYRRWGIGGALLVIPFLWVSVEYIRSNFFFLSFPWALLAHTQYRCPPFLQIISITGTYGLSFLIVSVNAAMAGLILAATESWTLRKGKARGGKPIAGRDLAMALGMAVVLVAVTLIYGFYELNQPIEGDTIRVSVIQGNIEQSRKWDRDFADYIMDTYSGLTLEASKSKPVLIIWPETATPGLVTLNPELYRRVRTLAAETGGHLLLGSSLQRKLSKGGVTQMAYHNSAFLVPPTSNPGLPPRYDKIYLLPFGEYIPLRGNLPWQWIGIPEIKGFVPGETFKVFEFQDARFSVTICWENFFPELVRQFVRNGARFIVNITNEAWFGTLGASHQFLSMSVMRAVENRVFLVRCANTGVSCFIDPHGRIVDRVKDDTGKDTFIQGFLTGSVMTNKGKSVYTYLGDWLALICLVASGLLLVEAWLSGCGIRISWKN